MNQLLYLLAIVLLLSGLNASIHNVILAFLLANVVFGLLLVLIVWRDFGISFPLRGSVLQRIVTFNFAGHVGTIVQRLSYRLDVFIIAFFLPTTQVGLYAVATSVGQLMWYLPNAIGIVLLSRTAGGGREKADARLVLVCQSLVIGMGLVCLVAWVTASTLFPLIFGDDFQGSSWPFTLLLPGIFSLSLWKVLANDMTGRGRPAYKLYSAAPGAIATVVLDLTLIPHYGIAGAALASSIAYSLTTAVIVVLASREMHISMWSLLIPDEHTFRMMFEQVRPVAERSVKEIHAK